MPTKDPLADLSPLSFLQMFVTQSIKLSGSASGAVRAEAIEYLGLTASSCLELYARNQMQLPERMNREQYADLIVYIKNAIGGEFRSVVAGPGVVYVENRRCPFGARVQDAPELCRTTASVFGGIAARNFGYAKVELKRRIALRDDRCEVCIYTDREIAEGQMGDEYVSEGETIVSRQALADVRTRVAEKMAHALCPAGRKQDAHTRPSIVAESRAMREILRAVEQVAPTRASVLISGETGVGKEVIARAVHTLSPRSPRPFLAVNCGAVPHNLIETTLFGHEKGAFTGAYSLHRGLFERADQGTLFLDEIDSLPLFSQAKLLRVLQEGEYERVGGGQTHHVDVRVVAAANKSIESLVDAGQFRSDLYYRLNVVPIYIPPLRERPEDVAGLVHSLLAALARRHDGPLKSLSDRAWGQVMGHAWPGNVRELENVLERAFLFTPGRVIDDVELRDRTALDAPRAGPATGGLLHAVRGRATRTIETRMLQDALERHHGNVTAMAREMGITRRAIHQKLKRYALPAAPYRCDGRATRR